LFLINIEVRFSLLAIFICSKSLYCTDVDKIWNISKGPQSNSTENNWWTLLHCFCQVVPKHTHTQPFNGPLFGTTQVSRYQKGKTNLDFAEARDSEWQWHPLGHMQVCTSLQSDNHASTPPLTFLQAFLPFCPSCRPTNSVKALKALVPKSGQ